MLFQHEIILINLKQFCSVLDLKQFTVAQIKNELINLHGVVQETDSPVRTKENEDKQFMDLVNYFNCFLEKVFILVKPNPIPKEDAECENYSKNKHPCTFITLVCQISEKLIDLIFNYQSEKKYTNGIHFYYLIVVSLIYENTTSPWSCKNCYDTTKELKDKLCNVSQYDTFNEMLNDDMNRIQFKTLQLMTPFLSRNKWKQNPAFCEGFVSLLKQCEYSTLNSTLHMIFPVILLMIDDHNARFVLHGLEALQKLLKEIPGTEIRVNGRALVIYDALSKKLYVRDVNVLDETLSCLLKCLMLLERDPKKSDHRRNLTKFDETFQVLLSNTSMFSEQELLIILWKHLYNYINFMDITILRHVKELVELISWHLEIGNRNLLPHILKVLELLISIMWHRFSHFVPVILKALLKLLQAYSDEQLEENDKILMQIKSCILSLAKCNHAVIMDTISTLQQENEDWKKCLKIILPVS